MKCARGFTLVEILIVVVIVGFLAGMAVLAIGNDPQRQLKQEAQRALAVLQLASDEAMLEGREYGLILDDSGYQVALFDEKKRQWLPSPQNAFSRYELPDSIILSLETEGSTVDLAKLLTKQDSEKETPSDNDLAPALLILSSGEITPFTLAFSSDRQPHTAFSLSSDGLSEIQLSSLGER
jgi:general secretion pathway protein H